MKRAIVLSGGGSKGSYQIGVWKALKKLHISYDIVTGTSVGAINGAIMVQKSFRKAEKLWKNLNFKNIFDSELEKDYTTKDVIKVYGKNIIQNGGMDVTNLENFIKDKLNIDHFFKSPIDYGLITYNVTTKEMIYMTKKDLNKENLCDFIIASSTCYPAFQKKEIDGQTYIDGGFSDNVPINLAIDLGATEIIAVDLKCIGVRTKIKDKSIPITYITPQNTLAPLLIFDGDEAKKGIKFGYNDTMKCFHKLDGQEFTFYKNHLTKNYQKYYPKLLKILEDILDIKKSNMVDELLKTTIFNKFLNNKIKEKDWNEIIEQLGKNFKLDETKIYTIMHFNYLLKKELRNMRLLRTKEIEKKLLDQKIKDLLNTKWIILYLYQKIKTCNSDKERKDLTKLAIILPKEFFKALYLYIITTK